MNNQERFRFRAFTLIELLIVMAIIAILAAILLPVFASARERGRRTACASNMKQIELALTAYTQDNEGVFPAQIGTNDWASAIFHYAPTKDLFRCPTVQVPPEYEEPNTVLDTQTSKGYAINGNFYVNKADVTINDCIPGISATQVKLPATTVAFGEAAYQTFIDTLSNGTSGPAFTFLPTLTAPQDAHSFSVSGASFVGPAGGLRHNGGSNYAFVDGHVHWYTPAQVLNSDKPNNGSQPSFAL